MELQAFISKAIVDMFAEIEEARDKLRPNSVVPAVANTFDSVRTGISHIQPIDFEVVVRVDESKGSEAKLSVVAAVIGGHVQGQSRSGEGHTATLRFKVPVKFRQRLEDEKKG